jgi:hypothetical protein
VRRFSDATPSTAPDSLRMDADTLILVCIRYTGNANIEGAYVPQTPLISPTTEESVRATATVP